jgi:alkanesulfonate monooxygenase SsuD/methylene tetrahydromethanopterin reductase-like flavin-dependent oxidoreductase (luciferase family)
VKLRFGLALDFGRPAERQDRELERLLPLLHLAEGYGFESVWAGEQYPVEQTRAHLSSPFLVLARLAGETGLKLGTGVLLLPAWHPLRLAYDAAVLDHLTGGRCLLGVGVGQPALARRFGLDSSRVADYVDNMLAALRALWAGERRFDGRLLSIEGGVCPLPLSPGGPPIWVGGAVRRSVERAAALGDAWYAGTSYPLTTVVRQIERYRQALGRLGREAGAAVVAVNRLAVVTDDEAGARLAANTFVGDLVTLYAGLPGPAQRPTGAGPDGSSPGFDSDTYLVGTADQVAATVQKYADAGVTHLQFRVCPVGAPLEVAARTVELLGREVLPRFA